MMDSTLVKENGSYSLGRTSFWIIFIIFITYLLAGLTGYIHNIFWITEVNNYAGMVEIPDSLVQMLLILLGYNLGKKAVFAFEKSAEVKYTNTNYNPNQGYYNTGYSSYGPTPQGYNEQFTPGYSHVNNSYQQPPGGTRFETEKMTADIDYKDDKNNG